MATSGLLNMTVPLSDIGVSVSGQGLLMPKLKYRFRVLFVGFGATNDTYELTRQVMTVKRPSMDFEDQVLDVYNSKIHYPGKPKWDGTSIEIRDDMEGTCSSIIGEQIQKQFDFLNQSSASSASDFKFQLLYEELDGGNGANEPTILESWQLWGCFISKVDWDQSDYKSSEPLTIKMDIIFDNALQLGSEGIGTTVTRTNGTIAI